MTTSSITTKLATVLLTAGIDTAWDIIALGQRICRAAERLEATAEPYTGRCNIAWQLLTFGERVGALGETLEAWADGAAAGLGAPIAYPA